MNGSLSRRLFVWIAASIIVSSLASTVLSFILSYQDANELQDAQLRQVTATLAAQPAVAPQSRFRPHDSEDAETHLVVHVLGSRVVDPDPRIDVYLPDDLPAGLQTLEQGGVRWRVMAGKNASGQRFAVAQRQTVRDEVARNSALFTLLPMLVLAPLLLIVRLLLRQGFARMKQLSREVDAVDEGRLAALDPAGVPLEALPLVLAMNRLLSRLGSVLEQQRRMVADAAHELRTPISATRVQADNLGHANLDADTRGRLDALQRGLARISELIEQLLDFARVQGTSQARALDFSFDAEVRRAVEEALPLARRRGIDLGSTRLDLAVLHGDAAHAFALVRNAVDNAVRYSREGGSVDVNIETRSGQAVLTVDDSGGGIVQSERERVFEPFYRILGSGQAGSGLGLAIVRSAAQALGGHVELADRVDGQPGMRFTYTQKLA